MGTKRKVFIPLAITIILLIAFVVAWACISQNDYVFKINGQKISMNEFNPYLILQKKSMEAELGENVWDMLIDEAPAIETARDGAKQSLIDTVVKTQQAKERKLSLTQDEKEELRTYAEQYTNALTEYGITVEEFVKMNEDVALIEKLSVALYNEKDHSAHSHGKIDIVAYENGEETTNTITTFNSRHILFSTEGLDETEAEKVRIKAEGVLARILNGEDFATLAGEFSEDPGSKNNGGLYENIERGSFVTEYEAAAFSLNPGEVYPALVASGYGYHIIKLESITNPDGYISLAAAQNVLASELNEEAKKWISEAEIEVNPQRYNSAQ